MELSASAMTVLESRYLVRDPDTWEPTETPDALCRRVANAAADAGAKHGDDKSTWEKNFYELLDQQKFIPNSPTLMNAGLEDGEWAACYVLPIEDSMEAILDTHRTMCMVQRMGGGTGFDFSRLRPKGDRVYKTQGTASGPLSFLRMYSAATEEVKQGGRRRGANMAVLRIDHPDVLEFISCKDSENTVLVNFNISVGITEEFLDAVRNGTDWDFINPRTKEVTGSMPAQELWDAIAQNAWRMADPGVLFLDEANKYNPTPDIGRLEATNPCGESWLLPNEACTLGSINLAKFAEMSGIMWDNLKLTVRQAVRFLDNTIDASSYATEDIKLMHQGNRKIGLGIMGFHDALIKMGIPYQAEEALGVVTSVMQMINETAHAESNILAKERGVFPNFEAYAFKEKWGEQRNAHVTVIAPTGTISIIAGCSSGIEPIFAIALRRENVLGKETLYDMHPLFEWMLGDVVGVGTDRYNEILEFVHENGKMPSVDPGSAEESLRLLFTTSDEIPWEWHVRMQAAFQQNTDNAVSKTINMPEETTWQEIQQAFWMMHDMGCKGGTVYRDNSKITQVLNFGKAPKLVVAINEQRPDELPGVTHKVSTGVGNAYITVNILDGRPFEVFVEVGKAGSDMSAYDQGIGRLISVGLQHGVPVEELSRQLIGIGGATRSLINGSAISIPDAVGRVLSGYTKRKEEEHSHDGAHIITRDICPKCGLATIERVSRCDICHNCGYSTC